MEKEIKETIAYMVDNARSDPNISLPLYHRLSVFFETGFIKILTKKYPKKYLIERFIYVDSHHKAKYDEVIDQMYSSVKKYMTSFNLLRIDGKALYQLEWKPKQDKNKRIP